jgi:MFS superfamily sulfate permease-like transporter
VSVDSTGVAALESVLDDFDRRRIAFYVARAKHPAREQLDRSGLTARIRPDHFFATVRAAVAAGAGLADDEGHDRRDDDGRR